MAADEVNASSRAAQGTIQGVGLTPPQETIVITRALWSNTFKVAAAAALGGWLVAGVLGFTVYKLAERPIPTRYFESINGKLIQAKPTDQPMLSAGEILTGAQQALEGSYDMNFRDYRMRMQNAEKWFTQQGYSAYKKSLFGSGDIKAIEGRRLFLDIAVTGAPVVAQQGVLSGTHTFAWKVQVPVELDFESSGYQSSKMYLATLVMVRVDNVARPRGWAVDSIIFGPMPNRG
ncbi:DotI/IcmL/TraM family protein [Acidithiobacillus ferriphilus]|uniref:DotI/IcmL/TraM family protein n=1 Tax=Acidithiobacillus ferriphilus TaxID=1689834 RepID=UPI002DB89633|nr:DotI/IcmL/TraM family protein [Acidithiobacillus ferriphilus]MEB8535521.1 DotI/IcmL/TraM family protein [Acidithiobacillus ferriphilus]